MNANGGKKYRLAKREKVDGRLYWRIEALRDIPRHGVKAGDKGGLIEKEESLSQDGDGWVGDNAIVAIHAHVGGAGLVCGNALVDFAATVYGWVGDNAIVSEFATVVEGQRVGGTTYYGENEEILYQEGLAKDAGAGCDSVEVGDDYYLDDIPF